MHNEKLRIMKTPREVAATGIMAEHAIRVLIRQGRMPGIRIGNRYLINYTALCEMLSQPDKGITVNE